jgi:hypothetical protein
MMLRQSLKTTAGKSAFGTVLLSAALLAIVAPGLAAPETRIVAAGERPSDGIPASQRGVPLANRYAEARTPRSPVGANRTLTIGGARSASKHKGEIEIQSHSWGAASKGAKPQSRVFPKWYPQKSRGFRVAPKRP